MAPLQMPWMSNPATTTCQLPIEPHHRHRRPTWLPVISDCAQPLPVAFAPASAPVVHAGIEAETSTGNANGKGGAASAAAIELSLNDGSLPEMSLRNPPSLPRTVHGVGPSSNCTFNLPRALGARHGRTHQQRRASLAAEVEADTNVPEGHGGHPLVDESKDQPEHGLLPTVDGGPMSPAQAAAPPAAGDGKFGLSATARTNTNKHSTN